MSPMTLEDFKKFDFEMIEARRIASKRIPKGYYMKEYWAVYRLGRKAGLSPSMARREATKVARIRYARYLRYETRNELQRRNDERSKNKQADKRKEA